MIEINQDEVTQNWLKQERFPMVSIQCMAYNHASYIAFALDGFLSQKTTFPFEIIVHDDASTDGTADIIRVYEKKFPNIVRPIYEKENQYSKKDGSLGKIIDAACSGKYIAFCEGDDFWCDSQKLQRAVVFLEKNTNYSACTHNTMLINNMTRKYEKRVMFPSEDSDLTLKDILAGVDFHTSSIVCLRDMWLNRPSFCFAQPGVGDFPFKVFLSLNGPIKRFGDVMSVYRWGAPNSWTSKLMKCPENSIRNTINAMKMLCMANEWSKGVSEDVFFHAISRMLYRNYLKLGQFKIVRKEPFHTFWESESFFNKTKHFLRYLKNVRMLKNSSCLIEQLNNIYLELNERK